MDRHSAAASCCTFRASRRGLVRCGLAFLERVRAIGVFGGIVLGGDFETGIWGVDFGVETTGEIVGEAACGAGRVAGSTVRVVEGAGD